MSHHRTHNTYATRNIWAYDQPRLAQLGTRDVWLKTLRTAFDYLLIALLFVAPLVLGGRDARGHLVYELLVGLMATTWLVRSSLQRSSVWQLSGAEWLLATSVLLILAQFVPLPLGLLHWLSPTQAEVLPEWSQAADSLLGHQVWSTVTLTPRATLAGLVMFVSHATLFLVIVQRLRELADVEWMLRRIAAATAWMAIVGLLQYLSGTDKFAWLFEHPTREAHRMVTGPFINPNHFGHFVVLGLGPGLWWLMNLIDYRPKPKENQRGFDQRRRFDQQYGMYLFAVGFLLFIMALSACLTRSRGVYLAGVVGTIIYGALTLHSRTRSNRSLAITLSAVAAIGVVAVTGVYLHGHRQIQREVSTLVTGSLDDMDRGEWRRHVWAANLQVLRHFPVMGAGVGSHAEIYRLYFSQPVDVEFTHAESSYLQLLSETGLAGGTLLLAGLLLLMRWCWKSQVRSRGPRERAAATAVITGLAVSLAHSVFDFPWFIPACMSLAILLAACAHRLAQLSQALADTSQKTASASHGGWLRWLRSQELRVPAFASYQLTAVVASMLTGMVLTQWPAARAEHFWVEYLKMALQESPLAITAGQIDLEMDPAKLQRQRAERLQRQATHLRDVLRRDPHHALANQRLASVYLALFDYAQEHSANAIGVTQIRDAAIASRFPSRSAQDRWLAAATGENRKLLDLAYRHLVSSITMNPLEGRGYLLLAQVAFLEGVGTSGNTRLMHQAELVRPYDGGVAFEIGREAILAGQMEKGLIYWKRAYQQTDDYRESITAFFAASMEAALFIDYFEPDEMGTQMLFTVYRQNGREDQARIVGPMLLDRQLTQAKAAVGRNAARHWEKARAMYRYLGDNERALQCAQSAVESEPQRYQARFLLAHEYMVSNRWSDAVAELQWCVGRRPHDEELKTKLERARQRALMGDVEVAEQSKPKPAFQLPAPPLDFSQSTTAAPLSPTPSMPVPTTPSLPVPTTPPQGTSEAPVGQFTINPYASTNQTVSSNAAVGNSTLPPPSTTTTVTGSPTVPAGPVTTQWHDPAQPEARTAQPPSLGVPTLGR
ncbi:MAG: O-antigen ligase family protein [Planctomycetales bacterium]|nr:O-antigen ligase family protein [Planctomycetales bacterium]